MIWILLDIAALVTAFHVIKYGTQGDMQHEEQRQAPVHRVYLLQGLRQHQPHGTLRRPRHQVRTEEGR